MQTTQQCKRITQRGTLCRNQTTNALRDCGAHTGRFYISDNTIEIPITGYPDLNDILEKIGEPDTSPQELSQYSDSHDNPEIDLALAINHRTPPHTIAKIYSRHPSEGGLIHKAIAGNINTPDHILDDYVEFPRLWLTLAGNIGAHPRHLSRVAELHRTKRANNQYQLAVQLTLNPMSPNDALKHLMGWTGEIRNLIAAREDLADELQIEIAKAPDSRQTHREKYTAVGDRGTCATFYETIAVDARSHLINNPYLCDEAKQIIIHSGHLDLLRDLALAPYTEARHLEDILNQCAEPYIQAHAISNPNCPIAVVEGYTDSASQRVRVGVASRATTPLALSALGNDHRSDVAKAVLNNPAVTSMIVREMTTHPKWTIRHAAKKRLKELVR